MKRLLVLLGFLSLASLQGMAGSGDPIQIQVIQPLYFGGLLVSPSGGSITLTPDGALIPDGPGVQPGANPPALAARFMLTGPPGAAFTLKVDPQFPMLTSPQGGSVRLAQFHCSLPDFQGNLDATGQLEVKLGGRLDIAVNTQPDAFIAPQVKLQMLVKDAGGRATTSAPLTIGVLLRAQLVLANVGPLDFGWLVPGSRRAAFEVLPGGGYRESAPDGPVLHQGIPRPALFQLQGNPGSCYIIQLPQKVELTGPGTPMIVEGFTCSLPLTGIFATGDLAFGVGGSLMVDPDQGHGHYKGTLVVTVAYQ